MIEDMNLSGVHWQENEETVASILDQLNMDDVDEAFAILALLPVRRLWDVLVLLECPPHLTMTGIRDWLNGRVHSARGTS